MSFVRNETPGLPRLHSRRSDADTKRPKLGSQRVAVPTRSVINNSVLDVQTSLEMPGSRPELVHPLSPREKDQQTNLMRPKSTPGTSRTSLQPHYRSDTHSAAARRPTTSDPAATRVPFDGLKVLHDTTNTGGGSANADSMKALAELQAENESLRHAIRQLHVTLLDKMRGANKVVGGGQFRVVTSSSGTSGVSKPLPDHFVCSKSSSLRTESSSLKHELAQLNGAKEELERYVETLEKQQTTWSSEREEQKMEIEQLERTVSESSQARAIARVDREQLELQVQTVRSELERVRGELVESEAQIERDRAAVSVVGRAETKDAAVQAALGDDGDSEREEEAMRRLQQEMELLSRQLDALKATAEAARIDLEGERERSQSVKMESERRVHQLQEDVDERQALIDCLKRDVGTLRRSNARLAEDLATKDRELAGCKRQHAQLVDDMMASHRELLADSQRSLDEEIRGLNTVNADLKRRCSQLEADKAFQATRIHQLTEEIAVKNDQIRKYQAAAESIDRVNAESSHPTDSEELLRFEEDLKQTNSSLQSTLASLQEAHALAESLQVEVDERDDVIARMIEAHAQTIKRALDKTLRLCVVAPTVNVHLNTPSSSKKTLPGLEVVHCRSSPPGLAIQDVVEKEILPFFTKIMLQPDQSEWSDRSTSGVSGVNPGVLSDEWLQQLLDGMKTQLADRIESVYASMTPST